MNQDPHHFALFRLPVQYAFDPELLEQSYRQVQSQAHPDRFASGSDVEKRVAMQWAMRANEAYQTLRSPLKRAAYLCELHGIDLAVETDTAMPAAFLMQQMEWREQLQEARATGNSAALQVLEKQLKTIQQQFQQTLLQQIDQHADYLAAAQSVRQWMFVDKFAAEIDAAYAALEI